MLGRLFDVLNEFVLADGIAVIRTFRSAENESRKDRHSSETKERAVNAVNHFGGAGVETVGDEEGGGERGGGDTKTHGHLLHGAGDGAGAAGLFGCDVGVNQRVHARVLQRGEEAIAKRLHDDEPSRRVSADSGEQHDHQPMMMVLEMSTLR